MSRPGSKVQHRQGSSQTSTADPIEALHARAKKDARTSLRGSSLLWRTTKNMLYVVAFGVTGFAAAWGLKTWQYLHMGRSIAEPATRAKIKGMFSTAIEASPLVQSLRQDGWIEEDATKQVYNVEDGTPQNTGSRNGQHMVQERLVNDGYLTSKQFRHPAENMTVLVFMADFACESWPNTLHGGIATTVIQEALDAHLKNFPGYAPIRNRNTTMNYRYPLNPRVVYSVLVRTDGVEYPDQPPRGKDKSVAGIAVDVLLNQMDRAPRYTEKYDEETKRHERKCIIHDMDPARKAYVQGGSILFLATKDYRGLSEKNQQMIPKLQEKLLAWQKSSSSPKPSKAG